MKRSVLLSTICSLALIGCSKSYTNLKPISPELAYRGLTEVDSLTPTFRWEPSPEPDATYDFIIYEGPEYSPWTYTLQAPGKEVYYREGLQETVHKIEEPLRPNREHQWSVRVRRGTKVSHWSLWSDLRGNNLHFIFQTPEEPEDAHK
jgi:hypothetical protein